MAGAAAHDPPRLARGPVGMPHVHHRVTDSTNERAKELGARGAPHGTLVTAGEQTAGRGRQGRRWHAPAGRALLASVIVRPLGQDDALMPLAAAVAVCEACEAVAPVTCGIKWPNDVWIDRSKVAGVLIEGRPQEGWAVVGAGINVTTAADELPPEVREHATSLAMAAPGGRPTVAALLAALLRSLETWLDNDGARVLDAWRSRDALAGREVAWKDGSGTVAGIDHEGALLVETATGVVALDSGEVHLRAPG